MLLNAGYGIIQIGGSIISGSQALQADALDFIGDGLISFLGLIAVGWGLAARAKAALLQGIFLALLGLGVIGSTAYRVFVEHEPQTLLMGSFALVAFVVNVLAAVVLIPHRKGDANMRAVWLFSRNDAIGNLAVIAAAALVWWLNNPWPDLLMVSSWRPYSCNRPGRLSRTHVLIWNRQAGREGCPCRIDDGYRGCARSGDKGLGAEQPRTLRPRVGLPAFRFAASDL